MVDAKIRACHTRLGVYKQFLTTLLCALVYAEFWSLGVVYLLRMPRDVWGAGAANAILTAPRRVRLEYGDWNTAVDGRTHTSTETAFTGCYLHRSAYCYIGLVIAPVIAWYTESIVLFAGLIASLGVLVVSYKWGIKQPSQIVGPTVVTFVPLAIEVFNLAYFRTHRKGKNVNRI